MTRGWSILVRTAPGLEGFLEEELRRMDIKGERERGGVQTRAGPGTIARINYVSRIAHKVFIILWEGEVRSLEDIEKVALEPDYVSIIPPTKTFGVRGVRSGKHNFTSVDIGRVVGASVIRRFEEDTGKRLRVNLSDPDVEIFAVLEDKKFRLMINTTGESLHKRYPRPYQHPAPIKASIAAALLRAAGFRRGGKIMDPMVGGGTIVAEAACIDMDRPPGFYRSFWMYENLAGFRRFREDRERECKGDILGTDLFYKHVRGAKRNLWTAGIDCVRVERGDARRLDHYNGGVVVTNPPYGLRIASKAIAYSLYKDFAEVCRRRKVPRVVMVTPKKRVTIEEFTKRGYQLSLENWVMYGTLPVWILRFDL